MKLIQCAQCRGNYIDQVVKGNKVLYKCYVCNQVFNQAIAVDSRYKLELDKNGDLYHESISLLIKDSQNRILLLRRRFFPFTWSLHFGHVHNGEVAEDTIIREATEEIGIKIDNYKFLFKQMLEASCNTGIKLHRLSVFEVNLKDSDKIVVNDESTTHAWAYLSDIKEGRFQPLSRNTRFIFRKLNLL